jgi:hypothetical protein
MTNESSHSTSGSAAPLLQLFQMVGGYWLAQIVHVVAKLGIADHLAGGPKTAEMLARVTATDSAALSRLLRTSAAFGLLEEVEPQTFRLSPLGETLRSDVPGSARDYAIAIVGPGHWRPWGQLDRAIASGQSTFEDEFGMPMWEYYRQHEQEGTHFAGAMSCLSTMVAHEVVACYQVAGCKKIVDVGASQGKLLLALLKQAPDANGILFDLPYVLEGARESMQDADLRHRVELVGGDFFQEVPSGGDLYLLKQILHDWDDGQCSTILRNIHRAAAPQSKLLIVEMLIPDKPEPSSVFLLDLSMLVLLGGRERTRQEFAALLSAAGYQLERIIPTTTGLFSVMEAVHV